MASDFLLLNHNNEHLTTKDFCTFTQLLIFPFKTFKEGLLPKGVTWIPNWPAHYQYTLSPAMVGVSNPSNLQLSDRQNTSGRFNLHCVWSHFHHLCTFLLGLIPLIIKPLMRMFTLCLHCPNLTSYYCFFTLLMVPLRASQVVQQ